MDLEKLGYIQEIRFDDHYEGMIFAQVYLAFRRSLRHKNQKIITPESRHWSILQEAMGTALEFCEATAKIGDLRTGFAEFLDFAQSLGLSSLRDLASKRDYIMDTYTDYSIVTSDPNPRVSEAILSAYQKLYTTHTGYPAKDPALPRDYIPFIKAAELSLGYHLSPREYVEYLWAQWEWAGILKPSQLKGPKAEEYLRDYVKDRPEPNRNIKKVTLKKGASRW